MQSYASCPVFQGVVAACSVAPLALVLLVLQHIAVSACLSFWDFAASFIQVNFVQCIVRVWATAWATTGVYTAYFWESLHNCTSCWWPIRKKGSSFSLGMRRDKAARFLLQKKITNRRCRVSLSWSVEVYKGKNKGIVSIKTNLSVGKLLFNELLRCLELPRETAILPYTLQYAGIECLCCVCWDSA